MSRRFRNLIVALIAALGGYLLYERGALTPEPQRPASEAMQEVGSEEAIERAFAQQQSNVPVEATGVVVRILNDDNEGSRHQRFIVRLASGHTVLIAHNIDLAPRVEPLAVGDRVEFFGEYEWNEKGGVVHWTHHDPVGTHQDGWIRRNGRTFQ